MESRRATTAESARAFIRMNTILLAAWIVESRRRLAADGPPPHSPMFTPPPIIIVIGEYLPTKAAERRSASVGRNLGLFLIALIRVQRVLASLRISPAYGTVTPEVSLL